MSQSAESAVIYPAAFGIKLAARPPIMLRKGKSAWRVDLSAMAQEPGHDPAVIRQYHAAAKALRNAARRFAPAALEPWQKRSNPWAVILTSVPPHNSN